MELVKNNGTEPLKHICATCKFFKIDGQNLKKGWCCHSKPLSMIVPLPDGFRSYDHRPVVNRDDPGCEHYQPATRFLNA